MIVKNLLNRAGTKIRGKYYVDENSEIQISFADTKKPVNRDELSPALNRMIDKLLDTLINKDNKVYGKYEVAENDFFFVRREIARVEQIPSVYGDIIINIDDKVFNADGRTGRITDILLEKTTEKDGFFPCEITYNNDEKDYVELLDAISKFSRFYLIGKNFFGNKINIEQFKKEIEQEKRKIDYMRKRLWTLENQMCPDWKEKQTKAREDYKKRHSEEQKNKSAD